MYWFNRVSHKPTKNNLDDQKTKLHGCKRLTKFIVFFTVADVKRKFNILRSSLARVQKPAVSGSAAKPETKRAEWLKQKLVFLMPHCGRRVSTSNLAVNTSVSKICYLNDQQKS